MTKEQEKMKLYYDVLTEMDLTQIECHLDNINVNDLLLLKYFIEYKLFDGISNNIEKNNMLVSLIKNNIQSRMVDNGASRD